MDSSKILLEIKLREIEQQIYDLLAKLKTLEMELKCGQ